MCARLKFSFVLAPEKWKWAGKKGEESLRCFSPTFPQKCFSSILAPLSEAPPLCRGKQWNILCCSVCLIPILYASTKKPFHSDIHARAGISNTWCSLPCFTFTKKIGVSKNQDHVGLCVLFLKCVALSFQTSWSDFWSWATITHVCCLVSCVCVPALRGTFHQLDRGVCDYAGLTSGCGMWGWRFLSGSYSL